MNERIKELMEQAGLYDFVIESMGINEEMEKFAQLIVRECIDIADEYDGVGSTIVSRIREHFGVEE
jgi:hypothetical protein